MTLEERFYAAVQPGHIGVDLGCGREGVQARRLRSLGAKVVAVDSALVENGEQLGVTWVKQDIEIWLAGLDPEASWDFLHCRLVLQFLPRSLVDAVVNTAQRHLKPGGVAYFLTWFKPPEDGHPLASRPLTYLHAHDFALHYRGWASLQAQEYPMRLSGRFTGRMHRFHKTEVLLQR